MNAMTCLSMAHRYRDNGVAVGSIVWGVVGVGGIKCCNVVNMYGI